MAKQAKTQQTSKAEVIDAPEVAPAKVVKAEAPTQKKMVRTNCPNCKKQVEAMMTVSAAHHDLFPMSANRYVCQSCKKSWVVATGGHVAI